MRLLCMGQFHDDTETGVLGGSCVVVSQLISSVAVITVIVTHSCGHITPLITTHEPPSTP